MNGLKLIFIRQVPSLIFPSSDLKFNKVTAALLEGGRLQHTPALLRPYLIHQNDVLNLSWVALLLDVKADWQGNFCRNRHSKR